MKWHCWRPTRVLIALAFLAGAVELSLSQESLDSYADLQPSDFYADFATTPVGFRAFMDVLDDAGRQRIPPFRIFDNLYYVGTRSVSSFLLTTADGYILIDSLYGEYVEDIVKGMTQLRLDPADVKYVLVTHGHFDHVGGAAYFQEAFGAHVAMAAWDWKRAEADADFEEYPIRLPARDLVIGDGDVLELGDQVIRFYVTPGHTEGVLSMEFVVRDGDDQHRAFVFGGAGLNFRGAWRTQTYISSLRRIQTIAKSVPKVEVNLTNHPAGGRILERYDEMVRAQSSGPHPFVDAAGFTAYLERLLDDAQEKLSLELEAKRP
jgi:metallo-beta-lactamase class B